MNIKKLLFLSLLFAAPAFGQGMRYDNFVLKPLTAGGVTPVSGALITVCTSAGTGTPCTPKVANIYSDEALTTPITGTGGAGTTNSDANGNFGFYAAPGSYVVTVTGSGFTSYTIKITLPIGIATNNIVFADLQTGADACAKINAAFLSLPTRGGIVDARGIVGAQTCATNPFAGITAVGGLLLLGNTTIVSNAQWIVPNKTRIVGIGRGGGASGNGENTTIQAGSSFPVSTGGALVRLGTGGGSFGTRLENLTVDCNGQTNCTSGIYSNDIEEKSGASYVTINNFVGNGIFVDGSGANFAQHYSFDNLEVQPLNIGTGTTIGIKLLGNGTGPYELRNITVIGNAGHQILHCVNMNATTIGGIYNLHGEGCVNVLMLGDTAAVSNLNVIGVEPTNGGNPVTTVVSLNNAGSAAITLIGIARSSASGNTLTDNITTHTSTATFIGFYSIGNGSPRTITTNDTSLVNITPTTAMVGVLNMNGFNITDGGTGTFGIGPISALTNGKGVQVFNTTTTCTTAASVGATCTTAAITLPVAEADTSYRITCTGKGLTNVPVVIATTNSSATQFTITIAALTAAAASFTSYDCSVGHN